MRQRHPCQAISWNEVSFSINHFQKTHSYNWTSLLLEYVWVITLKKGHYPQSNKAVHKMGNIFVDLVSGYYVEDREISKNNRKTTQLKNGSYNMGEYVSQ